MYRNHHVHRRPKSRDGDAGMKVKGLHWQPHFNKFSAEQDGWRLDLDKRYIIAHMVSGLRHTNRQYGWSLWTKGDDLQKVEHHFKTLKAAMRDASRWAKRNRHNT